MSFVLPNPQGFDYEKKSLLTSQMPQSFMAKASLKCFGKFDPGFT